MADINIEKKKKSNTPIWPWILGLLLLVGVIWAIVEMTGEPEREQVAVAEEPYREDGIEREPQSNRMAATSATAGFVSYVNDRDVKDRMGEDHQVIAEALTRLSAALEGLSQNNNAYSQQIDEIRQSAREIQSDPQSQQHADKVKDAFTTAANVMGQIQQNQYPDAESDVQDLQEKSQEIDASKQLSEQKDEVESFFEKAADAIEKMEEKEEAM